MKAIRYKLHFATLSLAAVVFLLANRLRLPYWISNFDFFHYGLMGALHAACIVVSLRDRKVARPIIALCFITLATVWSAATPILGLWGSIVWVPFYDFLRRHQLGAYAIVLTGSAIGASGYWLLVRQFWLRSLQGTDWLRSVALCMVATTLSGVALDVMNPSVDILSPTITVAWWFAFSISLYWSEMSERANKSAKMIETVL
jgi:hypothetical protein